MSQEHNTPTTDPGAGIIPALGDLTSDALINEEGLARIFGRCRVSIRRAVERGELPRPIRLFGSPTWTVQVLREHMAGRLDRAKREADQAQRRISQLSA